MTQLSIDKIASDPIGSWQILHAEGGVARIAEGWLIGSHDLVKAGLNERALTTAGALAAPFSTAETRCSAYKAFARFWSNAMIMHEGDRHSILREALHPGLRRINESCFKESMQQKIGSLVAELPRDGPFDLVEKLARPLPIEVIAELLGIPPHYLFAHYEQAETVTKFLAGDDSPAVRDRVLERTEQLWILFSSVDARDGLLSELRQSQLRANEIIAQSILVFLAGHQTLRDAICSIVICLAQAPEYQAAVREKRIEPARIIEESLRLESPVQVAARTARIDLTLGPVDLRASDRVLLCIGAANRDPRRYIAPDEFRPHGSRPPSIVFGAGPHTCWGAALAQLELRFVTQMLFDSGRIHLCGPPVRDTSLVFRKINQLQVQVESWTG